MSFLGRHQRLVIEWVYIYAILLIASMISYELEARTLHCCLILIIVIYPVGILVVHTEYWTVNWANQYSQCSARCIDDPGYGAVRVATTTRCSGSASTATGKIDLRDYNGSSSPSLYYFVKQYIHIYLTIPCTSKAIIGLCAQAAYALESSSLNHHCHIEAFFLMDSTAQIIKLWRIWIKYQGPIA